MSKPVLFVRQCNSCGCVVADPTGILSGFRSNSWCPKCHSSWMTYRQATPIERIRAALHLMIVYDPDKPQKQRKQKQPPTFEELVRELLTGKNRTKAAEVKKSLRGYFTAEDVPQRLSMLAYFCEQAADCAASDMNRELAMDLIESFRYIVTEDYDLTLEWPDQVRRLNAAIRSLYEQGSEVFRTKLIRNATGIYNIQPFALRGLYNVIMEDGDLLRSSLSHLKGFRNEHSRAMVMDKGTDGTVPGFPGHLYPIFDYCVRHKEDISTDIKEEILEYFRDKAVLAGNLPAYFRRYYLPDIGKPSNDALGAWFEEAYCTPGE